MRALALRRFGASAFSPSSKGGLRETPRDIGSLVLLSLGIVIDCRDYHIYRTAGIHSSRRTILGNIYCFSYSYKYAGSGTELPKHICQVLNFKSLVRTWRRPAPLQRNEKRNVSEVRSNSIGNKPYLAANYMLVD